MSTIRLERLENPNTSDGGIDIDSSGNVGIGTNAPGAPLEVNGGNARMVDTNGRIYLQNGNTTNGAKIGVRGTSDATDGYLAFGTNSIEFARFDSSGNFGLGTAAPSKKLEIAATSAEAGIALSSSGRTLVMTSHEQGGVSQATKIGTTSNHELRIITNDTERMRVASSGFVGIGATSPSHELHIAGSGDTRALITSGGSGDAVMMFENSSGNTWGHGIDVSSGNYVIAYNSSGDPSLTTQGVLNIDTSGKLLVGTSNGTDRGRLTVAYDVDSNNDIETSASIVLQNRNQSLNSELAGGIFMDCFRDVANPAFAGGIWFLRNQEVGNASSSTTIVFGTQSNPTAGLPGERMRILHTGIVDLGHGGGEARFRTNATDHHQFSRTSTATTNLTFIQFGRSGTSPGIYTVEGDIRTNGSGNLAFNNASDVTLKENIRDLDDCLETVNSLRPVLFDWKEEHRAGCTDIKGFIAQEFEQVLPKSVSTDENGLKSIAPETELLPLLVGALKEATARIETLEAKVAALEAP